MVLDSTWSQHTQHSTVIRRKLATQARCCKTRISPDRRRQACHIQQRKDCIFFLLGEILDSLQLPDWLSSPLALIVFIDWQIRKHPAERSKLFSLSFLNIRTPFIWRDMKSILMCFFLSFVAISPIRGVHSIKFLAFHYSTLSQIITIPEKALFLYHSQTYAESLTWNICSYWSFSFSRQKVDATQAGVHKSAFLLQQHFFFFHWDQTSIRPDYFLSNSRCRW